MSRTAPFTGFRFLAVWSLLTAACLALLSGVAAGDEVLRGDDAWDRRAEGEVAGRPQPGPILEAVSAYEAALASRPEDLGVHWKLLQAFYFAGFFAAEEKDEKRALYERALAVSEQGLELLARRVGGELDPEDPERLRALLVERGVPATDVARLHFWTAINWGAWSRVVGLFDAVRKGVANRLRRSALMTIALEPSYHTGGAFRLLGRLHAELPRVPFLSGWVDRDQAVPLIERAVEIAPDDPGNRLLLAITLLDHAPERRSEALDLLREIVDLTPRPSMRIEDLAMRREAAEKLEQEDEG
jgi:tetratricopeptide (TPR) repeat protein